MIYDNFKFIYPPRAESKTKPALISMYDTEEYIAQPKYNGSCCNVFLHYGAFIKVINRHGEQKTRVDSFIKFEQIETEGWTVLSGELMDKSKKGEDGNPITGFVIWDILVHNNKYLVGSTTSERIDLMENLWPCQRMRVDKNGLIGYNHLCHTGIDGIFRSPSYVGGVDYFPKLYKDIIKTDAYEGLLLKKVNAKLEIGFNEKNNSGWQLKVRKPVKNYSF